ncbi:MAG TPA: cyclase family protein [Flavobacteriales bacterium]|nr:cyclase family protein [Flavobacteriales bacterium]
MLDVSKYDLSRPLDISIPLSASPNNVSAWYVSPPEIKPVEMGSWVGDVNRGGSVNFRNIFFNPHGHGTHTECVGHITKEFYSVNQLLTTFLFKAVVVTVKPEHVTGDHVIYPEQITHLPLEQYEALVIRTFPNTTDKLHRQYSHTNPPYLHEKTALHVREKGIKHLLIDLPSVDKEEDGGKLLAHRAFWNYPDNTRFDCTITEFIFVPGAIADGEYLLNLQVAPFENDASPSRPVLYALR